ncbi:MAG TPA: response regulator [Coriobacteriia bacterium]|nr:response regulator [Coriobacteriia bacterium]
MVEFDRSAFISKFQEEAADLLQRLNESVITLEASPADRELIDQMLRDAHTLKGSSRMVGLINISDVAHHLEDFMVRVRDGELAYEPSMSEVFFEALDAIVYLTEQRGENADGALDLEALQGRLVELAATPGATPHEASPAADAQAKVAADEPAVDVAESDEAAESIGATDAAAEPAEPEAVEATSGREGVDELKAKAQPTIRVKTHQVDSLLNLVSETVIGQIKAEQRVREVRNLNAQALELWQSWGRLKASLAALSESGVRVPQQALELIDGALYDHRRAIAAHAKEYSDDVTRASLVVADLQEQATELRMLPANTIFQTFPRSVRELARQFNKDVELEIEGGATELDKKVLEEINDPLVHIMRNAVDHGIESPEARIAAGKPPTGRITISARQEGDRIAIRVADDGAGIDPDSVRAHAVRKGYITEAEAATMSDRQATFLIFEAGFSTAPIITEISGRGVGMDVVREFVVEKLKGDLDVTSKLGEGTSFTLTIPLTLAIIRALFVRAGGQLFALPTASVEETLRVKPEELLDIDGRKVVRRGVRSYPLVYLSDLLGLPRQPENGKAVTLVTMGYAGYRMGFIVDAFAGEQQIVIKPLGTHLLKVDNVAGVTVMGAGDVVPILNVPDLMMNGRTRVGQRPALAEPVTPSGPRSVLICEDSFTTRELERSIFESAGYSVETASDGAAGLAKLQEGLRPDAVVTDVQMPNMTGFQLASAIKADSKLAQIPVVIVTSLEREEEKAEGIAAGADAYITKSVFNQDTLLDTVERLIG